MSTKIDWCDEVWNPTTGCTKVSAGCKNCYAEGISRRFWGARKFTDVQCHEDRLDIPFKWRKPRTVFVDSMSDLFHPDVPDRFIDRVFARMCVAKYHMFVVLTKRVERMEQYFRRVKSAMENDITGTNVLWQMGGYWEPIPLALPNVVLGVSVENQPAAHLRIPYLLQTPAAYRVVSVEPMLEEIDLTDWLKPDYAGIYRAAEWSPVDRTDPRYNSLDGVICGCESGPNRRPFDLDWARSMRDQCVDAGVPFFLKQMPVDGKIVHMPALDGVVWDQLPWGRK